MASLLLVVCVWSKSGSGGSLCREAKLDWARMSGRDAGAKGENGAARNGILANVSVYCTPCSARCAALWRLRRALCSHSWRIIGQFAKPGFTPAAILLLSPITVLWPFHVPASQLTGTNVTLPAFHYAMRSQIASSLARHIVTFYISFHRLSPALASCVIAPRQRRVMVPFFSLERPFACPARRILAFGLGS
jgi:hypothetical protein